MAENNRVSYRRDVEWLGVPHRAGEDLQRLITVSRSRVLA